MTATAIDVLTNYWNEIYQSADPMTKLRQKEACFPDELKKTMDQPNFLYPEPFYGPLQDDMTGDLLLLLMNPGDVNDVDKYSSVINETVITRYTSWRRNNYLLECGRLDTNWIEIPREKKTICFPPCPLHALGDTGCSWRRTRYREAKFDVGLNFELLNTMEYIPYHSKYYKQMNSVKKWIHKADTTNMSFNAIYEIVTKHLVKFVVGLGSAWIDILKKRGFKPVEDIRILSFNGNIQGRLLRYQLTPDSLPIVIHLIRRAVKLPSYPGVINEMRRMLGQPITVASDPSDRIVNLLYGQKNK